MLSVESSGSIKLTRGDTARLSITIKDKLTGNNYELAEDDKLTFTMRDRPTSSKILIQKVLTGSAAFHIEPADTAKLSFGDYSYDVQLDTADGDVYTVIGPAKFTVAQEVTY